MSASTYSRGDLRRIPGCPEWHPGDVFPEIKGGLGWQSNGGPTRRHPARALPFTLEVQIPKSQSRLKFVHLAGIFAVHADPSIEPAGAIGAVFSLQKTKQIVHRVDFIQGRHYGDAQDGTPIFRPNGDGTTIESLGICDHDEKSYRVDKLTIEVPHQVSPDAVVLSDLGSPASFVIFDVIFEFDAAAQCPFRGSGDQVALSEIGSILRLRDLPKFETALNQIEAGILNGSANLDEARGLGLTFLSAVTSSLLEMGAARSIHLFLLQSARTFDTIDTKTEVADVALRLARELTADLFPHVESGEAFIHRALSYVDRHFAEDLTDDKTASYVGLSTSHFRFLFKKVVRQPFQKYLMALRLEKSREMLLQGNQTIAEIAELCGFVSAAHFSRVFSQRFGMAPSALRTARRTDI